MPKEPYELDQCALYKIKSPNQLCRVFGVNRRTLEGLANNENRHRVFTLSPKSKKPRVVQEPIPELQRIHKKVTRYLSRIKSPSYLNSAIKSRSYITNAQPHIGSTRRFTVDIKSFYTSVSFAKVVWFFEERMKCSREVAVLLTKIITYNGHLPTGSSSSPILSYYAYSDMFDEICNLADNAGVTMTLYVDDLTFSGEGADRYLLNDVIETIKKYGLVPHKIKTSNNKNGFVVTGVAVTRERLKAPHIRHNEVHEVLKRFNRANDDERKKAIAKVYGKLNELASLEGGIWNSRCSTMLGEKRRLQNQLQKDR
ncbi:MAG: RNA-directed DNA polymerase [Kordiimonadaceae bacterium]|nr:RNA-directed DNA polymerase [Kordiimonadaceae bacterium]